MAIETANIQKLLQLLSHDFASKNELDANYNHFPLKTVSSLPRNKCAHNKWIAEKKAFRDGQRSVIDGKETLKAL